jgi:uncharacterized protein
MSPSDLMLALYGGDRDRAAAMRAERDGLDVFEAAALGDVAQLRARLDEDPAASRAWSDDGFTALHYAAFFGTAETARLLIERGAGLEAPSRNEEFAPQARPLHSAAAGRNHPVCVVLLEAGADANARQHGGFTPLLEAAQQGNEQLVELLLTLGARPGDRADDGRTAADLAEAGGHVALAARLRSA